MRRKSELGLFSFILGSMFGSTHTVERHTEYKVEYKCPLLKKKNDLPKIHIRIEPRFKTREDIEEYFYGKPRNEETMAELKAALEEFDRRNK